MTTHGRRRPHRRRTIRLIAFLTVALGLAITAFVAFRGETPGLHLRRAVKSESGPPETPTLLKIDDHGAAGPDLARPIYRHSVVPGGVFDRSEVERAAERDVVVRAHYAGLRFAALRSRHTTARRMRYMSYRTSTGVYWTRRPVALPKGEVILDDGVHELRARCGNLISDEPRTPTLETEPAPPSFDEIEPILPVTRRPVPTAYAPLLPGKAAPELWPGTPRNPQRRAVPMILVWSPRTSTSTSGTADSPGVEGPVVSDHVPDDPATGAGDDPATGADDPGPDGGDPGADTGDPVPGPGDPGRPSFPDPFFPPSDPWRPPTPTDPSEPPAKVPEPGTLLLIGVGGAAAGLFRARRQR